MIYLEGIFYCKTGIYLDMKRKKHLFLCYTINNIKGQFLKKTEIVYDIILYNRCYQA